MENGVVKDDVIERIKANTVTFFPFTTYILRFSLRAFVSTIKEEKSGAANLFM